MQIKTPRGTVVPPFDRWNEAVTQEVIALVNAGELDVASHIDRRTRLWLYQEEMSPEEAAQVLLGDYEPTPPPNWEKIAQGGVIRWPTVPNMYRPPTTPAAKRDAAMFQAAARDLGVMLTPEVLAFGEKFEAMAQRGPIKGQAPRIDIKPGDDVAWPTAGKGKVANVFDVISNDRVCTVEIPGWYVTGEGYLTREDTGHRATLDILARDLTVRTGEE